MPDIKKEVKKLPKVEVLKTLYCDGEFNYPGEIIEFNGSKTELERLKKIGAVK